jgi:hypothetical protein
MMTKPGKSSQFAEAYQELENRRSMSAADTFADTRSIELMGREVPIADIWRTSPEPPQSILAIIGLE